MKPWTPEQAERIHYYIADICPECGGHLDPANRSAEDPHPKVCPVGLRERYLRLYDGARQIHGTQIMIQWLETIAKGPHLMMQMAAPANARQLPFEIASLRRPVIALLTPMRLFHRPLVFAGDIRNRN